MTRDPGSVVAGYDGSAEAAAAVRWAARYAWAAKRPLQVVHCSLWPLLTRHLGPVPGVSGSGLEQSAQAVLDEGVAQAVAEVQGVGIRSSLVHGLPAQLLVDMSAGEHLLVVGSRGLGGFLGLLVGSVSLELAAAAACPVAVIRQDAHPQGPVLAAVDSAGSPSALADACGLAVAWQAPLKVVHVHHEPSGHFRAARGPGPDPEQVLNAALAHAASLAPSVPVHGTLVRDHSVPHGILGAAGGARIVVVGSQGSGILRETIGSTAHAVLHRAPGPVLVSRHG
ncbi:universal stress protein [Pseudarthrobacter phenanthrenivorans]|uniref:Universal stress protein n=1 Tax=Pseudarthrobacter phenanthrenivorans TaxID=361575 RepID=A0A0B4D3H8_PSEPS|nr:universal stress protein [Pseudarthrobacter phenanthrenivorans]KIC67959.1 universal stress protein [Pseudarthrobacter phenanthrenivorans]